MVPQAYYYMYACIQQYSEYWTEYEILDDVLHRILHTYNEPDNYLLPPSVVETAL